MPKWLLKVMDHPLWRGLEGVHTLVWVYSTLTTSAVARVGYMQGIPMIWIILGAIVLFVLLVLIGYAIYLYTGFYSLHEASIKVYNELRHLGVGAFSKGFSNVGGSDADGDDVLDEVGTHVGQVVTIYGRDPPATVLDPLPVWLFPQGNISQGAREFRRYGETKAVYKDLAIRRSDLRVAINGIRGYFDHEEAVREERAKAKAGKAVAAGELNSDSASKGSGAS